MINTEISDLYKKIQTLVEKLNKMETEKKHYVGSDVDLNILESNINSLEIDIESERKRYNNLVELQNYQKLCDHEFVEDLIDLTPENSVMVKYCSRCLFCCDEINS